jgi:hypothetical protein
MDRDRDSAFNQTCACGKLFFHLAAFSNHRKKCKISKMRLSRALVSAKKATIAVGQGDTPATAVITVEANGLLDVTSEHIQVQNHAEVRGRRHFERHTLAVIDFPRIQRPAYDP